MKKSIILLSLLSLLTASAFCDEAVDDFYDMAKNFFDAGDYVSAQEYAEMVLKVDPNHYGAHCLTVTLESPKEYLKDNNLSTQIIIRPVNVSSGDKASDAENYKGQTCYAKSDYQMAIMYFQNALKINKSNYYAYNNLGLAYWKLGNLKKAEQYLRKANAVSETFTVPLDNLAQMQITQGYYKAASKTLTEAISKNKKDYCAYYLSGILNKKITKFPESLKNFQLAIQANPRFALSYMQIADVYFLMEDLRKSNSAIERYLEFSPNDDFAYYMLFRNYYNMGEYNIAKNYILKAILLNNCIDYRIVLADTEDKLDNPKAAIESLKTIPTPSAEVLNLIGTYYQELEDYENALKYYKQTFSRPDVKSTYLYNAALVYKKIGDIANYKKVLYGLDSIPLKTYQDFIDLSDIFMKISNKQKAIDVLNQGIKIAPHIRPLYEAKLKIYNDTSDKLGIEATQKEINKVFK